MSQAKPAPGPQAVVNSSSTPNTRPPNPRSNSKPCVPSSSTIAPETNSQNPDSSASIIDVEASSSTIAPETDSKEPDPDASTSSTVAPETDSKNPDSSASTTAVEASSSTIALETDSKKPDSDASTTDVSSSSTIALETDSKKPGSGASTNDDGASSSTIVPEIELQNLTSHASKSDDTRDSSTVTHEIELQKSDSDVSKSDDVTESGKVTPKTEDGDVEEDEQWPDVLYQTRLLVPDEDYLRIYYSGKRFPEWSNTRNESKRSKSNIELIRTVGGSWREEYKTNQLKSMEEHQWKRDDLHVDFKKHVRIGEQYSSAMIIHDPIFREAMKSLIKYDPSQDLTGDEIHIGLPWKMLMHYYEEIESLRDRLSNSDAASSETSETNWRMENSKKVQSINNILEVIKGDYENVVRPELQNHTKSGVAEFSKLWLLFRPGEEVFATVNGKMAAFIVLAYHDHEPGTSTTTHGPIKQFIVHMWNLRFVAGRLVRHTSKIAIDKYERTRQIHKLPVYPCKYGPKDGTKQKLLERGQRFFEMIQKPHAYMKHQGLTRDAKPRSYHGRVIIDSLSYVKFSSNNPRSGAEMDTDEWLSSCKELLSSDEPKREKNSVHFEPVKPSEVIEPDDYGGGELWKKYIDLDPLDSKTKEPGFLEDRHYLLCPTIIRGFSLKNKQWETYDVESLTEIDWPHDDPFTRLVLDKKDRNKIMANCRLAKSRRESPDLLAEQLGGKGAGTVMLLHGPPGVGKTYTVECIANYTRQPLLYLSGCDMGSSQDLEANVQHWFELARAWNALVLLDEADIFLTYRDKDDRERNLLVSVFLQAIEEFDGVLFLATNRIGQIDLAINSRVDIDIEFKRPEDDGKRALWIQFFENINAESTRLGRGPYIPERKIDQFLDDPKVKSSKLSGRDIRNAFKQATRMARDEIISSDREQGPKQFMLKPRHIIEAMKDCEKRIQYILDANGVNTEEELASRRYERCITGSDSRRDEVDIMS